MYEGVINNTLADVKTTIVYKASQDSDEYIVWDASEYMQQNPTYTDKTGEFYWDVPEGFWKVIAEKEGYNKNETDWMIVPPERTGIALNLDTLEAPHLSYAYYYVDGSISIGFDQYMNPGTFSSMIICDADNNELTYQIEFSNEEKDANGNVYVKEVKLITDCVDKKVSVLIPNTVKNYCGTSIDEQKLILEMSEIPIINPIENLQMIVDSSKDISISIGGIDNPTIMVECSSDYGLEIKNNIDSLSIKAYLPGDYIVKLGLNNSSVETTFNVHVFDYGEKNPNDEETTNVQIETTTERETTYQVESTSADSSTAEETGTTTVIETTTKQITTTVELTTTVPETTGSDTEVTTTEPIETTTDQIVTTVEPTQEETTTNIETTIKETTVFQGVLPHQSIPAVMKPAKVKGLKLKNIKKKSIKVTFRKAAYAKQYKIQYATNKKFKKAKSKKVSNLKFILKKLKKGKTYYIRVAGLNGKVQGIWLKPKKVKIKNSKNSK